MDDSPVLAARRAALGGGWSDCGRPVGEFLDAGLGAGGCSAHI